MSGDTIIGKLDKILLYAVIYTVVFITFYLILPYFLPFVLGTIIALIAQKPINFITKKLKLKRGLVGTVIVLIIFSAVSLLVTIIVIKIVNELITLSYMLPGFFEWIKSEGYKYLDTAALYYHTIDPSIIESVKNMSNKIFSSSFTAAVYIVNFILNILKSLPSLLMVILFTLLTSVYVAIDLPKIKKKFFSMFSRENGSKARNIVFQSNKMLGAFVKAYLILLSITFVLTYIGTSFLNIKYALLLSIITSISDLLPILGPGTVLIPTALTYIIGGSYFKGIGILVIYIVILVVRQILEPKVVSSSLGVYPLAILVALFVGLKAYGFTGMIFAVFFVVFYVILQKVEVL